MNRHLPHAEQKRLGRERAGRLIRAARERAGLSTTAVEQQLAMRPTAFGESYLAAVEAGHMELLERYRAPLCALLGLDESTLPRYLAGQRNRRELS